MKVGCWFDNPLSALSGGMSLFPHICGKIDEGCGYLVGHVEAPGKTALVDLRSEPDESVRTVSQRRRVNTAVSTCAVFTYTVSYTIQLPRFHLLQLSCLSFTLPVYRHTFLFGLLFGSIWVKALLHIYISH
jgi:hypothetical protein